MGTEHYLVCEAKKELYDLGRGVWHELDQITPESIKKAVAAHFDNYAEEGDVKATGRLVANSVTDWCSDREWKVRLITDADDEFGEMRDWEVTGEIFDVNPVTPEVIQERLSKAVERLMDELGLDSVEIKVTAEEVDLFLEEDQPALGWSVWAQRSYSSQTSGYKRIEIKRDF